jgi:hypothetical protein
MTSDEAATFPRPFVPITDLPGTDLDPDALNTPEFIAKQVAILDARRRQGMNLIVLGDDGRIVKIAPDGTETDVTAELDHEMARACRQMNRDA